MLSSFVENKNILWGIYKAQEPRFDNIWLVEFTVVTGSETHVIVRFDSTDLPVDLPEKWKQQHVNCVQFILDFGDTTLRNLNISQNNYKNVNMIIQPLEEKLRIRFDDNHGNQVLEFDSRWIYIKNINGYINSAEG